MLTKINKIKYLGLVFRDFTWAPDVAEFRQVNLIYGWNGCGKTTLTRLFDEVVSPSDAGIEFELEIADGTKFRRGDTFPHAIRVFNQDYIQKNVHILESRANTISVLLGEQNKELVEQIEANERALNGDPSDPTKSGRVREFQGFTQKKLRKDKENDTAFSDIARTIGAAIVGSGSASRTYRSPDAKRDFEALKQPALLSDEVLDARILALKQDPLPVLDLLLLPSLAVDGKNQPFTDAVDTCHSEAEELCARTVEAEMIERLRDNLDIAAWVEEGRRIHTEHNSPNCEYCGNTVTKERLSQLARHFSEADQQLKVRIDGVLARVREARTVINGFAPHDMARLYNELQLPFKVGVDAFKAAKMRLIDEIAEIEKALEAKKSRTGERLPVQAALNTSSLIQALNQVNETVKAHNTKSGDFQKVRDDAVRDIKVHYLSTIYEDVIKRNAEIKELKPDLERRAAEIEAIRQSIKSARAAISSTHKACEQINDALRTFLGREELRFEPDANALEDDDGDQSQVAVGYRIMRGDQPAEYLSEGEKTAIAFVYFVVHLSDGQFPKDNGIVVIDDPISSLDSNSLYQAFSFLKNAVNDCHQVFVLTHNFDFLKLLLNWRRQLRGNGYYMIRNEFVENERRAIVAAMDKELQGYDSEYQYLFKELKRMRANQDGTLMRAYPVPNVARKVWEAFLVYRVPNSESPYRKMDQLKADGFDPQKLDAIYKFTNDQSHITGAGFNPALVPETQKVLGELFEMMQEIAPEHFAVLDEATPL